MQDLKMCYIRTNENDDVTIHTLPHSKCIRFVSVRSSLLCINLGMRTELTLKLISFLGGSTNDWRVKPRRINVVSTKIITIMDTYQWKHLIEVIHLVWLSIHLKKWSECRSSMRISKPGRTFRKTCFGLVEFDLCPNLGALGSRTNDKVR